ncbi:putative cystathionine gamma-synthase [Helianthus anomalus]
MSQVSLFSLSRQLTRFLYVLTSRWFQSSAMLKKPWFALMESLLHLLNQNDLALGADIVVHYATKYLGGHNDVLGGCVSGSTEIVSQVRMVHHVLGGTINPVKHVYYPGLKSHPEHELAKKQMTGFGGVVSFDSGSELTNICLSCKLIQNLIWILIKMIWKTSVPTMARSSIYMLISMCSSSLSDSTSMNIC